MRSRPTGRRRDEARLAAAGRLQTRARSRGDRRDHRRHGRITYVNDTFCRRSPGIHARSCIGQDHRIINSSYHPKEFIRELWRTIASGPVWHGELRNRAKDGHYLLGGHDDRAVPERARKAVPVHRHPRRHHRAKGGRGAARAAGGARARRTDGRRRGPRGAQSTRRHQGRHPGADVASAPGRLRASGHARHRRAHRLAERVDQRPDGLRAATTAPPEPLSSSVRCVADAVTDGPPRSGRVNRSTSRSKARTCRRPPTTS